MQKLKRSNWNAIIILYNDFQFMPCTYVMKTYFTGVRLGKSWPLALPAEQVFAVGKNAFISIAQLAVDL